MFSSLYLPLLSVHATTASMPELQHKIRHAQFLEAAATGERRRFGPETSLALPQTEADALCVYADIHTALANHEDAEELYRRHQRALGFDKKAVRFASFRNNAWKSLFQSRLASAFAGFRRMLDDKTLTSAQRIEMTVGAAVTLLAAGDAGSAEQLLATLDPEDIAPNTELILEALQADVSVQHYLRYSQRITNHTYWHPAAHDSWRTMGQLDTLMRKLDRDSDFEAIPVLRDRLAYLRALLMLSEGDDYAVPSVLRHLGWVEREGMSDYEVAVRLEIALAAIAGNLTDIADMMLTACRHRYQSEPTHGRWILDYFFCSARLAEQHGKLELTVRMLRDYAGTALEFARRDSTIAALASTIVPRPAEGAGDDISVCLPAKYRRAYRYLIVQLRDPGLSVRRVAEHIGVTERALQAAFKAHLGMSPSEVIRVRRMERIREELTDTHHSASANILETAAKWGVRNRSTLLNSYRKRFDEAPSETVERAA